VAAQRFKININISTIPTFLPLKGRRIFLTAGSALQRVAAADRCLCLKIAWHDSTSLEIAVSPTVTSKQEVAQLLEQLPDDASLEDIQYHVYVLEKIQRARADIAAGKSHTTKQAREWLTLPA